MDIAFNRRQYNRTFALSGCALLLNRPLDFVKRRAGRCRGIHELGQENLLPFILLADRIERGNQFLFDQLKRRHRLKQLACGGCRFPL